MFVGIDLGQRRVHVVTLDDELGLVAAAVEDAADSAALRRQIERADVVAVDAPEALSTAPHAGESSLSPKFRAARCAGISLGRDHGIWVPWATPVAGAALPPWMDVGLRVFELAATCGVRAIEVFPHAGFRALAEGGVPSKQSAAGLRRRAQLLRDAGVRVPGLDMWAHDSLDAALAALVAHQAQRDRARRVGCGHDASGIWLPRPARAGRPGGAQP